MKVLLGKKKRRGAETDLNGKVTPTVPRVKSVNDCEFTSDKVSLDLYDDRYDDPYGDCYDMQ